MQSQCLKLNKCLYYRVMDIFYNFVYKPILLYFSKIFSHFGHWGVFFPPFYLIIGMILVKKIYRGLGAQFCNTSSVHCLVCFPLQVTSLSITFMLPILLSTFPSLIHSPHSCLYPQAFFFFFFALFVGCCCCCMWWGGRVVLFCFVFDSAVS